jgi:hypothetical protein
VRVATELNVTAWGDNGDVAVFVHGSVGSGEYAWAAQRPLAEGYRWETA